MFFYENILCDPGSSITLFLFLGYDGTRSRIFAKESEGIIFKQYAWANVSYETKGNFFLLRYSNVNSF